MAWSGITLLQRRAGKHPSSTLAYTLDENGLRYILATNNHATGAHLQRWGHIPRGDDSHSQFLKRIANMIPPAGQAINVLAAEQYQIVPLDAPNVPASEMRQAVRWRAQEYLDQAPEAITLDLLALQLSQEAASPSISADAPQKVIAVAALNSLILDQIRDSEKLGLNLTAIDVPETAQRNLLNAALHHAATEPIAAQHACAILAIESRRALLTITVNGGLHLFRRIDFEMESLINAGIDTAVANPRDTDGESGSRSLIQLQRSLDLWERNNWKSPLNLLFVDAGTHTTTLIARLKQELNVRMQALDLSAVFTLPASDTPAPWHDTAYLPLLGALLRPADAYTTAMVNHAAPLSPHINLFNPGLLPAKQFFSALRLAQAAAAAVGIAVLASFWASFETATVRQQIAQQTTQQQQELAQLPPISDTPPRTPEQLAALEQIRQEYQTKLEARVSLRDELQNGLVEHGHSHSGMLRMVAQTIPAEVWLTDLQANGNQLRFGGKTLDPQALNQWMVKLGESDYFVSAPISTLQLASGDLADLATQGNTPSVTDPNAAPGYAKPRSAAGLYTFQLSATLKRPLAADGGKPS